MGLKVEAVAPDSFAHPAGDLEVWQDPATAPLLGPCRLWVAWRRGAVVGSWLTPTRGDGREAARDVRVLPYASPWLAPGSADRRRRVWRALLEAVVAEVDLLELPMSPGFDGLGALSAVGCLVETRHTHLLEGLQAPQASFSPTARAHARRAAATVRVTPQAVDAFDFARAIHGASEASLARRRRFATCLAEQGRAWALAAHCEGRPLGGIVGIRSAETIVAMHSWHDRAGPSGIPSQLVLALARLAHAHGARRVDLEGSVIAGVDRFMDTVSSRVLPVPHVHWARSRRRLLLSLEESLAIPGRVDLCDRSDEGQP